MRALWESVELLDVGAQRRALDVPPCPPTHDNQKLEAGPGRAMLPMRFPLTGRDSRRQAVEEGAEGRRRLR